MASQRPDIIGARKEGYTDTEIIEYLQGQKLIKADIPSARKEGYSDTEILNYIDSNNLYSLETQQETSRGAMLLEQTQEFFTRPVEPKPSTPQSREDQLASKDMPMQVHGLAGSGAGIPDLSWTDPSKPEPAVRQSRTQTWKETFEGSARSAKEFVDQARQFPVETLNALTGGVFQPKTLMALSYAVDYQTARWNPNFTKEEKETLRKKAEVANEEARDVGMNPEWIAQMALLGYNLRSIPGDVRFSVKAANTFKTARKLFDAAMKPDSGLTAQGKVIVGRRLDHLLTTKQRAIYNKQVEILRAEQAASGGTPQAQAAPAQLPATTTVQPMAQPPTATPVVPPQQAIATRPQMAVEAPQTAGPIPPPSGQIISPPMAVSEPLATPQAQPTQVQATPTPPLVAQEPVQTPPNKAELLSEYNALELAKKVTGHYKDNLKGADSLEVANEAAKTLYEYVNSNFDPSLGVPFSKYVNKHAGWAVQNARDRIANAHKQISASDISTVIDVTQEQGSGKFSPAQILEAEINTDLRRIAETTTSPEEAIARTKQMWQDMDDIKIIKHEYVDKNGRVMTANQLQGLSGDEIAALKTKKVKTSLKAQLLAQDDETISAMLQDSLTADVSASIEHQWAGQVRTATNLELPEIVGFIKSLTGKYPAVARGMNKTIARFNEKNGNITIRRDAFRGGVAERVLVHEIGHLLDYIPQEAIPKGNILAHALNLEKNLKKNIGGLLNGAVKQELINMQKEWSPYPANASPEFIKNRQHPAELAADAISYIVNDPELAKKKMPLFFEAWTKSSPEMYDEILALVEKANMTPDQKAELRKQAVDEMFERGDKDMAEKIIAKDMRSRRPMSTVVKENFIDKNQVWIDKKSQDLKAGTYRFDDDPLTFLEDLNYIHNKSYLMMQDIDKAFQVPIDMGVPMKDLETFVFANNILQGKQLVPGGGVEHKDIARPMGVDRKAAFGMLDKMRRDLGSEKWKAVNDAMNTFYQEGEKIMAFAHKTGLISDEVYLNAQLNPEYATTQVTKYAEEFIGPKIYKQIGTFEDQNAPIGPTIMKRIAINMAAHKNQVAQKAVASLVEHADHVVEITPDRAGRFKTNPEWGTIYVRENGKLKAFEVDPWYADTLQSKDPGKAAELIRMTFGSLSQNVFRKIFIDWNVGWLAGNLQRDFGTAVKAHPAKMVGSTAALQILAKSLDVAPEVQRYVDKGEVGNTIREMLDYGIIGTEGYLKYNVKDSADPNTTEYMRIAKQYMGKDAIKRQQTAVVGFVQTPLRAFQAYADELGKYNQFSEIIWKAAAWTDPEYIKAFPNPRERAWYVRNHVGSPDFRKSARLRATLNSILMFYQANVNGTTAALRLAFREPKTRVGWWVKTFETNIIPKIAYYLALYGALGEWFQDWAEGVDERDAMKYTLIPMGMRDNGNSAYLRIQQDELGRQVGSIFGHMLGAMLKAQPAEQVLGSMLDAAVGEFPGANPGLGLLIDGFTYLSGQTPRDHFRGRDVLDYQEQTLLREEGVLSKYPLQKMLAYSVDRFGLGWTMGPFSYKAMMSGKGRRISERERFFRDFPVLRRFYKETSAGRIGAIRDRKMERAAFRAERKKDKETNDIINGIFRRIWGDPKQEQ